MLQPETLNKSHGLDGRKGVVASLVVVVVDDVVVGAVVVVVVVPGKSNCFFVVNFQMGRVDGVVTGATVLVEVLSVDVTIGEYIKPRLVDGRVVVVVGDTTGGKEILCTVDDCASGNLAVVVTIVTGEPVVVIVTGDIELETVV